MLPELHVNCYICVLCFHYVNSGNVNLENVGQLVGENYDAHIDKLIAHGMPLETAKSCLDGRTSPGDVMPNAIGVNKEMIIIELQILKSSDCYEIYENTLPNSNVALPRQVYLPFIIGHDVTG